jgi:hypothetical protein
MSLSLRSLDDPAMIGGGEDRGLVERVADFVADVGQRFSGAWATSSTGRRPRGTLARLVRVQLGGFLP